MLSGYHSLSVTVEYGDWRLHSYSMENHHRVNLRKLSHLLVCPQEIELERVGWKGKHLGREFTHENCLCCGGVRYRECNPDVPGIVVRGVNNPYECEFRLIDGKHRVMRGCQSFYVIELKDVLGAIE